MTQADEDHEDDRVLTKGGEAPDADKAADGASAGSGPTKPDTAHLSPEEKHIKTREDELQDQANEESFPASDPPSAKHIT